MRRVSLPGGVPLCDTVGVAPCSGRGSPATLDKGPRWPAWPPAGAQTAPIPLHWLPGICACRVVGVGPSWPGQPRHMTHFSPPRRRLQLRQPVVVAWWREMRNLGGSMCGVVGLATLTLSTHAATSSTKMPMCRGAQGGGRVGVWGCLEVSSPCWLLLERETRCNRIVRARDKQLRLDVVGFYQDPEPQRGPSIVHHQSNTGPCWVGLN